ncbi:uncharacterized protein LOC128740600 [Sabethes cyaneus]|uniref:uncharacterized protein LOC128740600 n=1 Tax=Sabethes cyaneus TaxID=53552 RepID=UPI00237DBDF4|nr:uncharacterized protein LOC128740600 [Sabethes cyaneus]
MVKYPVILLFFINHAHGQHYFEDYFLNVYERAPLMLPNERLTLDDCHLRFPIFTVPMKVAPAAGLPVRLKEFAHIGAIGWTQPDGTILWSCGGTLIWDNFVLTAAHCALDARDKRPDVIRFGDLNIYTSEDDEHAQQLKIVDVIRHPAHRFAAQYHDIALMKLEKNVTLHDTVVPACLWTDDEVRFKTLEAAGWGRTGFAQEQTPVLLKVKLKPIDNEECGKIYTNETTRKLRDGLQDHHICAVDEKMDTCEGDSGGPLQIKLMHNGRVSPFLVGITSFGTVCGTSSAGVYTKVAPYHDWIVDTMRSNGAFVNENTYNATFCALRYKEFREYEDAVNTVKNNMVIGRDFSLLHMEVVESLPSYMVKLAWRTGDGRDDCYGAIIDETTVVTLAQCIFHNRLETGLKREHVCVGKDFFLVPKSCDLLVGGSVDGTIRRENEDYPVTFGLVQFGRDCGFGEHSVATGFAHHIEWMKSMLLPNHTETNSVLFLDDELHEDDTCISDDSKAAGLCVAVSRCPRKWRQFLSSGNAQFCSSSSVICCPLDDIESASDIHPDIASCPNVVRNIKTKKPNGSLVK